MTDQPSSPQAQIDALSRSVVAVDGSRRVGWAKAFSAIRQVDTLSHDLNIASEDRTLFHDKASFIIGYVERALITFGTPGHIVLAKLKDEIGIRGYANDNAILNHKQVRQGAEKAVGVLNDLGCADHEALKNPEAWLRGREERRRKKSRKDDAGRGDDWTPEQKQMRRAALEGLAEELGLTSVAELKARLRQVGEEQP